MSRFGILVYSRATGFVHASIPDAVTAIQALGATHDFTVDTTDDPGRFTPAGLAPYAALVFVHTSGDALPEAGQRAALESYIRGGGGFFGVHAASSMDAGVREGWPWFRALIGASFVGHTAARLYCDEAIDLPGVIHGGPLAAAPPDAERGGPEVRMVSWEPAVVHVEQPGSPAVRGIADGSTRSDEWYGFDDNPRPRVDVLATVDELTYAPFRGAMGPDHPIVWCQEFDGGRSVYNSMGHAAATWRDDTFLAGIVGGIEMAAGAVAMSASGAPDG